MVEQDHPPFPPDGSPEFLDFLGQSMIHDPEVRARPAALLKHIWIRAQTEGLSARLSYNEVNQTVRLHNSKSKEKGPSRRPQIANIFEESQNIGESSSSFDSLPSFEDQEATSGEASREASREADNSPVPEAADVPASDSSDAIDKEETAGSLRFNLDGIDGESLQAALGTDSIFDSIRFQHTDQINSDRSETAERASPEATPLLGNSHRWRPRTLRDFVLDRHSLTGLVFISRYNQRAWNHLNRFGYFCWIFCLPIWSALAYRQYLAGLVSNGPCSASCLQVLVTVAIAIVLLPVWAWLGRTIFSGFLGACASIPIVDTTVKVALTLAALSALCVGVVSVVLARANLSLSYIAVNLGVVFFLEFLTALVLWLCCRCSACELPRFYREEPAPL